MPGSSVRSRGNLLTVAPLPPVLPPNAVRHQPQIPYSTAIPVARPRGFEPLTFGSVVAKKSPKSRCRGIFGRGYLTPPRSLATRERARARHADRRPRLVPSRRELRAGEDAPLSKEQRAS